MAKPKIGYENLLELSTSVITVTSELAGFERELAANWNMYDGWRASAGGTVYYTVDLGSSMDVDYWASAGSNLFTNAGTIKLQYSSDNFVADTNDFTAVFTPFDSTAIFQTTAIAVSARYWRWEIISTTPTLFPVLVLGEAFEMVRAVKQGFELPHESRSLETMTLRAETGALLGRSTIRKGFSSRLQFDLLTLGFGRTDWSQFLDHAESKPFFLSWNPDFADAVYCWQVGDPMPTSYDTNRTIAVGINIKGLAPNPGVEPIIVPGLGVTLDPSNKGANLVLSNGGLTVNRSVSGGWENIKSTHFKSTGAWYWEVTVDFAPNAFTMVGLAQNDHIVLNNYTGFQVEGAGYFGNTGVNFFYIFGSNVALALPGYMGYAPGDVVRLRIDLTALTFEIAINGGAWALTPGPSLTASKSYSPAASLQLSGPSQLTFNFGASTFVYTVPAGFLSYDTP